jgi:recombinational DNA repair protein (RecF pathway)
MKEYVTSAVILDRQKNGDLDERITCFTRRFGKLSAKTKSSKKITSKLSGHVEPGNLVSMRFVETGGLQIVDVLKDRHVLRHIADLLPIAQLLPEHDPDEKIWHILTTSPFAWPRFLQALGWDPAHASCATCGQKPVEIFHIRTQEFFCSHCLKAYPNQRNGLVYITPKHHENTS